MSKELTSDLFQKAKDQVAEKNGFDSWKNLRFNAENFQGLDEIRSYNFYLEEAAELYASLQNAELLKELSDLVERFYSGRIGTYVFTESIKRIVQKYTDKK